MVLLSWNFINYQNLTYTDLIIFSKKYDQFCAKNKTLKILDISLFRTFLINQIIISYKIKPHTIKYISKRHWK